MVKLEEVEMIKDGVLPIIIDNRFQADNPCTDENVMNFLQDIYSGNEKTELEVSKVDWESRPCQRDREGISDVFLRAVKLPDGRYYLTLEFPDLEDEGEDPIKTEWILRI